MSTVDNQRKLLVAAGIAIAVLLMVIGVLLFNKFGQDSTIEEQQTEIEKISELKKQLDEDYENAIAELDEALIENSDLQAMIEEQKAELAKQKSKISRMISKGNTDLSAARSELNSLREQQAAFIAKIDQLEEEKQLLQNEIVQVREEKKIVEEVAVQEKAEKDSIMAVKAENEAAAAVEKEKLEKEKAFLANKVDIASVVKVENISAAGYKLKSGGKMVKKRYAKNVDVIKVCYDAQENKVTEKGVEQFFLRLITPLGTTMFVETMGSGTFVNKDSGQEMRFSRAQDVDYEGKELQKCVNWKPDMPFPKGIYQVELYNKGYLSGKGELKLK